MPSPSLPATPPAAPPFLVCDAARTAALLDFPSLVQALEAAAVAHDAGRILSPERLALPMPSGAVMLSMPAAADDIAIHKLVVVQPRNAAVGLPTIHGTVTVCDAATGRPLCALDGPEVTGRRTAAVSLLALRALSRREPAELLLVGTGTQARHHLEALHALHPACRVWVRGSSPQRTAAFVEQARTVHADTVACATGVPAGVAAVISLTTSTEPVHDEPPRADRVVIGVGAYRPEMAEIGPVTLAGSDVFADDPAGARHEAGDLMRAGVDWSRVRPLAALLRGEADPARPAVFKSVGTAAWDLAAARVALRGLGLAP